MTDPNKYPEKSTNPIGNLIRQAQKTGLYSVLKLIRTGFRSCIRWLRPERRTQTRKPAAGIATGAPKRN